MSEKKQKQEEQQAQTPQSLKEILKAEKAEEKAKARAKKKRKNVTYDINGNVIPDLNLKHKRGIESKKSWYGFFFILPWIIGMILFFIVPLFQSLYYSFGDVSVEPGEMVVDWSGLYNYKYIFNEDPSFVDNLTKSIGGFMGSLPIVVVVSLILALVLNGNFKGRTVFRGIFFIPVIVATGVVMSLLTKSYGGSSVIIQLSTDVQENAYTAAGTGGGMDFTTLLNGLNLPEDITAQMSSLITNIFNTIWTCGIPVVLFLAGLQQIPPQLYEASRVEGATAWEEFWKITLPMISQTLLLVIVFTLIELMTQSNNAVMTQAYSMMTDQADYGTSAAMLWVFFAIIGAFVGLIILLYSTLCLKRWEN